ncbi:hypothetical protein B0O80DRAFT_503137 [Mortierella sp. GBAus27b]|nr:hypothetical protein B0O80DRAFT_503137 [Mortierella sp. GBAus27b]
MQHAGFKDTFQQLLEKFVLTLLWGEKKEVAYPTANRAAHPTKQIMEEHLYDRCTAENEMGHSYGELFCDMYIGDHHEIRENQDSSIVDPKDSKRLLNVKRTALYGTTLSHRHHTNKLKRRRMLANSNADEVDANPNAVELPSISELQEAIKEPKYT